MGAVTPIVFSLEAGRTIEDLLAPDVAVDFELRGFGPVDRWPWVKPDTGLLVWDPERRGWESDTEINRAIFVHLWG